MDDYLTTDEVASLCRVSAETVRIWLRDGRLSGRHVGQRWLVARADVDRKLKGDVERGSEEIASSGSSSAVAGRSLSASASRAVIPRIIG
jgi:excisionase family DNA binding protein